MSKYYLILLLITFIGCTSSEEHRLTKTEEFETLLNGERQHKYYKNLDSAKAIYDWLTKLTISDSAKSYAYFGLGELAQQEQDTNSAFYYYDLAFSTYNQNLDALAYQAILVALTGHLDSARTYLKLGMQIDSSHYLIVSLRVECLEDFSFYSPFSIVSDEVTVAFTTLALF